LVAALAEAGHPVARIVVKSPTHIGQEFFRWEIATAVAGAVIGINPFNQPDVEASKIKTRALTDEYEKTGHLPAEQPLLQSDGVSVYADRGNAEALGHPTDLTAALRAHFKRVGHGDYVALLAYIERGVVPEKLLNDLRAYIRERTGAATCLGFGPRFLHSTGQAYKGGPNSGVFLQITCDDVADIAVPGKTYRFGVVKAAQARGDLGVLEERGRRVVRVHLANAEAGLRYLSATVRQALAS
jgi:transaldolase/glucose-6-phosphate isomerase